MTKIAVAKAESYDYENIKSALEGAFAAMNFDMECPLSNIVKPGMRVFIKPNWVASKWRASCEHEDNIYSVITHPTVIECVADYVAQALKGNGEIIIGDNPSIDADFQELMDLTNIRSLENKYDVSCRVLDLRPLICTDLKHYGKKDLMVKQQGDPEGTTKINLGENSLLYHMKPNLFRGVFDEREETIASHNKEDQWYSFSNSLYNADCYISIPKMKTHHKVGTTLNLKGLVGSIGNKNQLVHWRKGFPLVGGDEYPSFFEWLKGLFQNTKNRGAWPGNDTIWRMVVDLYNAFTIKERNYLSVVDGILGGQGKGPFCPTSKRSNTLIVGNDLVAVDIITTFMMGFNPRKIKYLNYFIENNTDLLERIEVFEKKSGNIEKTDISCLENLGFEPPEKWHSVTLKST